MVKTVQLLLKLPDKLLQKMDEIVLEEGYASRQEFIRELIRERTRASARVEFIEEEVARRRKMRFGGSRSLPLKNRQAVSQAYPPPPRSSLL